MAKTEEITLVSFEQVETLEQLRNNVKKLKSDMETLQVGSDEYKNTLAALKVNQNALKDAMYATTSTLSDVKEAATGAAQSYNGLVHRMASLKEELRATDVSTESGRQRFHELAAEINGVNDRLKEMDALQGNFQRNVGNYSSAFKGLGDRVEGLRKGLGAATGGLRGMKDGFEALSKTPAIAVVGILASVVMRLADAMKDNETATAGLKKGLEALRPVMDFLSGIIDKIAGLLADVISEVAAFVTSNGLIDKVIKGVMGVGNAVMQFVIAPFKGIVAAIKVFKEEGVKGIGNAARAFGQEMKSGVAFKQNFQTGQTVADTIISGAKSRKKEVKQAGVALGKEMGDGLQEAIESALASVSIEEEDLGVDAPGGKTDTSALGRLDVIAARRKAYAELEIEDEREKQAALYEIDKEANEQRLALLKQYSAETQDLDEYLDYQQRIADLEVQMDIDAKKRKKQIAQQDAKDRAAILQASVKQTSALLGAIADAYENMAGDSSKSAGKIKALRIAAATIDTISGAIGAFMQASETIPPPMGQIVGAASAASVTAAGLAQIAKIRATQVGSSGSSTGGSSAAVTAPSVSTPMTAVRSIAGASEEARLDQMAFGKRQVYLVYSDIEAAAEDTRVRVQEITF